MNHNSETTVNLPMTWKNNFDESFASQHVDDDDDDDGVSERTRNKKRRKI